MGSYMVFKVNTQVSYTVLQILLHSAHLSYLLVFKCKILLLCDPGLAWHSLYCSWDYLRLYNFTELALGLYWGIFPNVAVTCKHGND